MTRIEFDFEESPWLLTLDTLKSGSRIGAARFLTLMEGEEEDALTDAFRDMEDRRITLDISDLPRMGAVGEAALRLRREEELVRTNMLPAALE